MPIKIYDSVTIKSVVSPNYNYLFNKFTGEFMRWGATVEEDPLWAPAPEIADIEISAGGKCRAKCAWCYKSNGEGEEHKNMSVEDFDEILGKFPPTLTQVALGITDIDAHPDLIQILEACRNRGIVPNFTTNGLALRKVDVPAIVALVGAIAVSVYPHLGKDVCYNAVKMLTDAGLEQVNIHLLYHKDNLDFVYEVLKDTVNDSRLEYLNAVVLLGLKQKGRAEDGFTPLSKEEFSDLVKFCFDNDLRIGFDSCSAAKFEHALDEMDMPEEQKIDLLIMSERCESSLFSIYVNVDGMAFPCSFTEDGNGVDVLHCDNFLLQVWYSKEFMEFRERLLKNERKCPVYKIDE